MKNFTKTLLTALVSAALLTGCGAAGGTYKNAMMDAALAEAPAMDSASGIAGNSMYAEETAADGKYANADADKSMTQNTDSMTLLEEKLVYRCSIELETLDYQGAIKSIKSAIAQYGGVIQSENETDSSYNWYYADYYKTQGTMNNYIEVRVPSANYESFISSLDGVGKITSKSSSIDNISQQYYDTAAQIEAYKIQEKNLLKMLEECTTIEEMLTVQERLTSVQYELNRLETDKRYMDMDVAYSYVNISVAEVMEYRQDEEPIRTNTFIDRLKNTISATGRGFLVFLEALLFIIIRLSPYVIIAGIAGFLAAKKIKKRKQALKQALKQADEAQDTDK